MRKAKGFILGLLVTGASAAAFLAVGALLLSNLDALPQRALLRGVVTLALCVSSFLGGVTGALVSGEKGALLGGACGLTASLLLALASLVVWSQPFGAGGFARLAAIVLGGCIGGIVAVNKKTKVKF